MRLLQRDQIQVTGRVRRNFDIKALGDLSDSIQRLGLMHPPVVNEDNRLIAGERRLRAIDRLHEGNFSFRCNGLAIERGHYPVLLIDELDAAGRLEAELEENIRRENLTWQEEAAGQAALHDLRVQQHGTYHKTQNPEGQTINKTAAEIVGREDPGGSATVVSDNLFLAKHLDDPEVAQAASRADALKVLKAKSAAALTGLLAGRQAAVTSRHRVDCMDFASDSTVANVDVLCTDPPYGIDAQAFGSQTASDVQHGYDDTRENWYKVIANLARAMADPSKFSPRAHAYIFVSFKNYEVLAKMIGVHAPDWRVWHRPIIWDKGSQGLLPEPDYGPRYVHDYILYAIKGNKPVQFVMNDVINEPQLPNLRRAAEKPVALYWNLLRRSAAPGQLVWDPFCGSGPIFPAANRLDLRAIGHDIDEKAVAIAQSRFQEDSQ